MSLRYTLHLCLLSTSTVTLQAQVALGLEFKTGWASYSMNSLSQVLHTYQKNSPYTDITDDHPAYVSFGGRFNLQLNHWEVGLDYGYYSTGGRAYRSDYSGTTGFDQIATANALGPFGNYRFLHAKSLDLKMGLTLPMYWSKVDFKNYITIGNEHEEINQQTVARSAGVAPSLESCFYFLKYMYVGLRAGYCLGAYGPLHPKSSTNGRVLDSNGKPVHVEWAGLRADAYIGIKFPFTEP